MAGPGPISGTRAWAAPAARALASFPVASVSRAAAAGALGYAIQLGNGHLNAEAMVLLQWSIALTLIAVIAPSAAPSARAEVVTRGALLAVLAWQLVELFNSSPAIYLRDSSEQGLSPFRNGIVLAGALCLGLAAWEPSRRAIWSPLALLLLFVHFALGMWIIQASPNPFIDTYMFQRDAVDALLGGHNPYAITFPNIYHDESMYGPGLIRNGRLRFGFVYPPLSLLFSALGQLCGGDVRVAQVVASTLAGAGMLAFGGGGRVAALAAAVFLFTPRGFFVLEQSWTEPFLVFLFVWVAWSARRQLPVQPYLAGLLLAIKQHMALVVPLLWLIPGRPRTPRAFGWYLGKAGAIVALVTVPFVLWGPKAFYRSALLMQFKQPFRPDALSFAATWPVDHGWQLPQYAPFLCAAVSGAVALWRAPRTVSGFAGAAALVYLVFFACAKQAFCNYYYYVIGLLCCSIAAERVSPRVNPGELAVLRRSVVTSHGP